MTTQSGGTLFDPEPPDDTPDPGRSPAADLPGDDGWTWDDTRRALWGDNTEPKQRRT